MSQGTDQVSTIIEQTLQDNDLEYTRHQGAGGGPPGLVVALPGERRLKTNTILGIGEHSVRVEAFVCRRPDENHEAVYRFLLELMGAEAPSYPVALVAMESGAKLRKVAASASRKTGFDRTAANPHARQAA